MNDKLIPNEQLLKEVEQLRRRVKELEALEERRKEAEEAHRQSETFLKETQRIAQLGTLDWNIKTNELVLSDETLKIYGFEKNRKYSLEEITNLLHPDDKEDVERSLHDAVSDKSKHDMEHRMVRPDGEVIYINATAELVSDIDGKPVRLLGTVLDITERKEAEEALQESNSLLKSIIESPNNIIMFALDLNFNYLSFNEAHKKTMREIYDADIEIGHHILDYMPNEEDRLKAKTSYKRVLKGERFVEIQEYGQSNARSWYELIFNPIIDSSQNVTGFTVFVTDITERKEMEQKLLQSQKLEAIGKLAGGIAHDFNNMLTVINTHNFFLLDELDKDSPVRKEALIIQDTAERSALLVKQMMAFSRKQIQHLEIIDLNSFIGNFVKMLQPALREDIEIQTTLADDLGPIKADKSQVEQVIMNLAVNARDAMPLGGKLIIETANVNLDDAGAEQANLPPRSYVSLKVSDTGTGMDEDTLSQIFEPFFTTKDVDKGTGLGLSSVYGIIKQSNGSISVSSKPDSGTSFTILLPRFSNKLASEIPSFPATVDLDGEETILLVEDNKALRKGVRRILTGNGYHVLDADNGIEALEICEQHNGQIDLLLTDMVMPKMNGVDLAGRIRKRRPQIHVLLMSGYADGAVFEKEGFDDLSAFLLQKPFAPKVLLTRVRELLDIAPNNDGDKK